MQLARVLDVPHGHVSLIISADYRASTQVRRQRRHWLVVLMADRRQQLALKRSHHRPRQRRPLCHRHEAVKAQLVAWSSGIEHWFLADVLSLSYA